MPGTPPTLTARQKPSGCPMPDGYQTLVTLGVGEANLNVWERQVKPNAFDGGDPIDTTTMHNDIWRTYHPRSLKKVDSLTLTCGFQGSAINTLNGLVNSTQSITVQFPDGTAFAFYGWIQKMEFAELKEGEFPEVTITVFASNTDNACYEEGPAFGTEHGS